MFDICSSIDCMSLNAAPTDTVAASRATNPVYAGVMMLQHLRLQNLIHTLIFATERVLIVQ